ncbi:MAG: hypothetical protein QOJ64_2134 [Acidobacteriota bacterium]|nr:hypothetical protein [Acidobacteriota bacterium]
MFNWGTFNRKAYSIVTEGRWTLLVGENGSGKSTAVDALRTLLVPPSRLNYNDASGDQKRRDRTKRSYVRGAWASSSQDDSSAPITQYLRGEGTYCVLLAVFANERKGTATTIAQVLWEQGEEIKTLYVVSPKECSIRESFSHLPNTRDIRKELRRRDFDPTDTFTAYSERFRNALGIQSEAALEVFNHAIGVKEVRDINQFIRDHMLEPSDALEFINETLRPHYKTLQDCWDAIQKAEAQIKLLKPIAGFHEEIEAATVKKGDFERLLELTPLFFADRHSKLRREEESALRSESGTLIGRKSELDRMEQIDVRKRDVIKAELDSDSVAPRLELIKIQLENLRKQHGERRSRYEAIQGNLKVLEIVAVIDSAIGFNETRALVIDAREVAKREEERWRSKVISDEVVLSNLRENLRQFSDELDNLRKHRVLIPGPFLAIREALCDSLSLASDDLPFAGELIEVKAAYREWSGAIERLLHSFGVSLLVPDRHYRVVAGAINVRHLGLRFVFHRVPASEPALFQQPPAGQNRVCGRLNFRDDHPLRLWVQTEVNRRFRHVCCHDISELQREEYGITRQGLIRDGATRNIKDDRKRVDDVKNFVLGWSTEGKIQALNSAIAETERDINKALTFIDNSKRQQRTAEEKLHASDSVLALHNFDAINFLAAQTQIDNLVHEETELEQSSDKRKALNIHLQLIEKRLGSFKDEIGRILVEHGRIQLRLEQNLEAQEALRKTLEPHSEIDFQSFAGEIEAMYSDKVISLNNVDKIAADVCNSLRGKVNHQTAVINSARTEMVRDMTIFLHAYTEYRARLSDQVDFASEFVDLMRELENDDLPRHRKRFQEFLSSNLIGDMAMFNTRLEQHESSIRERIEQVNVALREVPFSPTTRVKLGPKGNRSDEVRKFKAELRNCIAGGINPNEEDRERIFGNIRELIEKFGKDPIWTQRVIDARNWFDFGVSETENNGDREVNYFAASSGKSGGQKTRLAFTILASAIAAQYGLAGFGDQSHTFRLVVIDEAFARTDEENSQLALELFKSLGLQLVIVSPFDAKARIVEDYVDTFHLATNPERNNSVLRRATRADYDAARDLHDADAA